MKLYHVSTNILDLEKEFIPRIPDCTGNMEDKTIPRICFAPTIEECIQATHVSEYYKGQKFIVYELDIDENDEDLISPEILYKEKLVPDALENNEYWLLRPVYLVGEVYEIIRVETEPVFAWTCINYEDLAKIIIAIIEKEEYLKIIKESKNPKECYEKAMNYADSIKDYYMMDEAYDKIAALPWATKNLVICANKRLLPFEEYEQYLEIFSLRKAS